MNKYHRRLIKIYLLIGFIFIFFFLTKETFVFAQNCGVQPDTVTCDPTCPVSSATVLGEHLCSPLNTTKTSLGNIQSFGPLGTIVNELFFEGGTASVVPASKRLAQVLSNIIGIITIVAGIWFMIKILIAGFSIISSSGDKNKMQEAQHTITNSVIGLTVVVAAYALTSLFGKILGIPNILNIGAAINLLSPNKDY